MNGEIGQKSYDFTKDYKGLPIKKRVGLILLAKSLLEKQKKNTALLTDASAFPPLSEGKKKPST